MTTSWEIVHVSIVVVVADGAPFRTYRFHGKSIFRVRVKLDCPVVLVRPVVAFFCLSKVKLILDLFTNIFFRYVSFSTLYAIRRTSGLNVMAPLIIHGRHVGFLLCLHTSMLVQEYLRLIQSFLSDMRERRELS